MTSKVEKKSFIEMTKTEQGSDVGENKVIMGWSKVISLARFWEPRLSL